MHPRPRCPPFRPCSVARKDIVERAATIDKENYYEMLGVAHDAKLDDVKAAYLGLAKGWHPDRLPIALADVKTRAAACSPA